MATRGHLGGLALATPEAVRLLDAVGYPWVLIETVGVGQVEVEIAGAADTTVVVVNPGWGDAVQANKAGLMEIADIFVINKADRPGAPETRRDLEQMLEMSSLGDDWWRPPIVETIANEHEGTAELWSVIVAHHDHALETGELARRRHDRLERELVQIATSLLAERARSLTDSDAFDEVRRRVADREIDPWTAAEELLS
jgi:LAO/AO transport system kinase